MSGFTERIMSESTIIKRETELFLLNTKDELN